MPLIPTRIESITVTDTVFRIGLNPLRRSVLESTAVTDSVRVALTPLRRSVFESTAVTEFRSVTRGYGRSVFESVGAPTDVVVRIIKHLGIHVVETVIVLDVYYEPNPYVDTSGLTNNLQWLVAIQKAFGTIDFGWTNGEDCVVDIGTVGNPLSFYFRKALSEDFTLSKSWSDILYGIAVTDELSFSIDNSGGEYTGPFYTAGNDWRGVEVRAYRYDWGIGQIYEEFVGVIENWEFGDIITINCISLDTDLLQVAIPREFVSTDNFPRAFADHMGRAISIVWGYATNIPLWYINKYEDEPIPADMKLVPPFSTLVETEPIYDYLVGRGNLGVDKVYRDGMLVDPSEYLVTTTLYRGFTSIRFQEIQTDFSGGLHFLTADVHGIYPQQVLQTDDWASTVLGTSGLVAYYRLNRNDLLSDEGPNELNGTLGVGAIAPTVIPGGVPGDPDWALYCAGAGWYEVPNAAPLNATEFSILFLFRHDGTSPPDIWERVAGKNTGSPNRAWQIDLEIVSGVGRVWLTVYDITGAASTAVTPAGVNYCDNRWHCVICTYRPPPSGRMRIFVDFVEVVNQAEGSTMALNAAPMILGGTGPGIYNLRGDLDEFAFFNRELSTIDVDKLFSVYQGTILEYKFNAVVQAYPTWDPTSAYIQDNGPHRIDCWSGDFRGLGHWDPPIAEPGYTGNGSSAVQLGVKSWLMAWWDDGHPNKKATQQKRVNWGFRLVFFTPQTGVAFASCVVLGPDSDLLPDGVTLTHGWGLFWTGTVSVNQYEFRVMTTTGLKVAATGDIGYNVWRDLYFVLCPSDALGAGRARLYIDGELKATLENCGDVVFRNVAFPGGIEIGIVKDNRTGGGWPVKLAYLRLSAEVPSGDLTVAKRENDHLRRNGAAFVQQLLVNDQWGLKQDTDSSFDTARADWNAINGGQGLPVDIELVEPTNSKDVLDSVLKLRGGRLYRASGITWGLEIDKAPGFTRFRFGHDDGQANNIVDTPRFSRSSLSEVIQTLEILYRSDRDPSSGSFSAYAFTLQKPLFKRGQFFQLEMPALHEHLSAIVFGDYYQKKLISADERLLFRCEEMSGRLAQPGSLIEVAVPRWGLDRSLYRIQRITKGLDQHEINAYKYDVHVYDVIVDPTLPSDPLLPDRFPVPQLGNWTLTVDPVLADSVLVGIELRFILQYKLNFKALFYSELTSWPAAGFNLATINGELPGYQLWGGVGPGWTYPLEDGYNVNDAQIPNGLNEKAILSVDVIVTVQNRTPDHTGKYRIRAQVGAGPIVTVKEVTMNNLVYPIYQWITETHRMTLSPAGTKWTVADIQQLKIYFACGPEIAGQNSSGIRVAHVRIATYPIDKLPIDFDSWIIWRQVGLATPVPSQYETSPMFAGKSSYFFDTNIDGTGYQTIYYWAAVRNRSGLISDLLAMSTAVNL